ncbi:lipoprotein [Philodulcilactobacillus myokoensis]|uniref:Lipoprotein n=1 Tax=Philodulcilactobacillus myokoensis TaxID=2929573 RepID=A0A9W6B1A7_9LACO|nr:MetQ/NlpA family ABC transporter substrate-binding protein [Philodulcilactobacillus myokoensis]GLB46289.1 lipoprotein [Philodulcilactobacillus myokoensis]
MKKFVKYLCLAVALLALPITLAACGNSGSKVVKVGIVGTDDQRIWNPLKSQLKKKGITLKLVTFSDYSQPNGALQNGEINLNAFQHKLFLDNWNKTNHGDLVSIGKTYLSPIGAYSHKIKNVSQIKNGDKIAIPNDAVNGGRALHLLANEGLIKLDNKPLPTTSDITSNPKHLKISSLDGSQEPRSLDDVTVAIINNTFALDAKLNPSNAIFREKVNKQSEPYINLIAAKKSDQNNKTLKEVVKAYQTSSNAKRIYKLYDHADIPAWNIKLK